MVNEWTRDDLPDATELCRMSVYNIDVMVDRNLNAIVDHLNANHPKSDTDRWRRAHEIVEQERDQARQAHREAWKHLDAAADRVVHEQTRAEDAERDRDEWRSRAEAAEARLADPYSQVNQDAAAWKRVAAHPALRMYLLPEADHTYAGGVFERITWLAEAAEARTAPTVTRDDIEKAIRGKVWAANREPNKAGFHRVHVDWATDAIHALVAGDDPAVFVVRESDVAAVKVTEAGQLWRAGETGVPLPWKANKVREKRDECATEWAELEAIARAIEADAEPADQVEELARQIEAATRQAVREVIDALGKSVDAQAVEDSILASVGEDARWLADHVLGQGDRHVDQ